MEGFTQLTNDGMLHKKITREGNGPQPKKGALVTVQYKGYFKNGKVFDQSYGREPFKFHVGAGEVIKGWDVGVLSMKTGEACTLFIKSDYAYGKSGAGGVIPGNTDLMFDVELLKC